MTESNKLSDNIVWESGKYHTFSLYSKANNILALMDWGNGWGDKYCKIKRIESTFTNVNELIMEIIKWMMERLLMIQMYFIHLQLVSNIVILYDLHNCEENSYQMLNPNGDFVNLRRYIYKYKNKIQLETRH